MRFGVLGTELEELVSLACKAFFGAFQRVEGKEENGRED